MIDETKPILFLFVSGALDITLTIIVVLSGWGREANPLINWITPDWMMCTTMVIGFSLLCLILIPLYKKYHQQYPIKTMVYSWSGIHLAGAFSGIAALTRVLI